MSIVTVPTSRAYIIRKESEAEATSLCSLAVNTAENFKGKVLKQQKLREGAYLLVLYFFDETLIKDWEMRTGISAMVPTSRTFIISDDVDAIALSQCSRAKDQATKCSGNILMENKLNEGIYLLMIFFRDESLMGFWESSMGVK